jgi:hypothetical protein
MIRSSRVRTIVALAVAATWAMGVSSAQAQESGFGWRLGVGIEQGDVASAPPHQDGGQTPAVWRVGVERALGDRFALGLDWTGSWFDGRFGTERRHALTATGTAYLWKGLHVRGGAGPGLVTWVDVDGPPADGVGDVVIGVSEGDPSLALTADVGYDLSLGPWQITPTVRLIAHRLHGETLTMSAVGARLWLRAR